MCYVADHPLANVNSQVPEHRLILYEAIGPGEHPCHWCQKPVLWTTKLLLKNDHLVVDHLDCDWRNNDIANLVPSCSLCNSLRAETRGVRDHEVFITRKNGSRLRAVNAVCTVCGTPFVTPKGRPKPTCGRSCGGTLSHRTRIA